MHGGGEVAVRTFISVPAILAGFARVIRSGSWGSLGSLKEEVALGD